MTNLWDMPPVTPDRLENISEPTDSDRALIREEAKRRALRDLFSPLMSELSVGRGERTVVHGNTTEAISIGLIRAGVIGLYGTYEGDIGSVIETTRNETSEELAWLTVNGNEPPPGFDTIEEAFQHGGEHGRYN